MVVCTSYRDISRKTTGLGKKVVSRLRECCRPSRAEVISKSTTKFTKPGDRLLAKPCTYVNSKIFMIGLLDIYIQRSAKVDAPGCVNAAGKLWQSNKLQLQLDQTWCTDFSRSLYILIGYSFQLTWRDDVVWLPKEQFLTGSGVPAGMRW